jgi:hypothetical protein
MSTIFLLLFLQRDSLLRHGSRLDRAQKGTVKYFPDEPASGKWARYAVAVLPFFYLIIALCPECSCARPRTELNHGADLTLGFPEIEDRFSEAYTRAFKVPLLDHSFYRNLLQRNFRPISYAQLTAEYPCIVVRIHLELDARTSVGLLELKPDHCLVEDIHVYTLGIANPGRCAARLRPSFARGRLWG